MQVPVIVYDKKMYGWTYVFKMQNDVCLHIIKEKATWWAPTAQVTQGSL